ncbi:MAG: hypothetical protein HYU66_01995 [Armatimonadetes bacterium]|nr:hypothetical protein [Armatimonadota bacterium]
MLAWLGLFVWSPWYPHVFLALTSGLFGLLIGTVVEVFGSRSPRRAIHVNRRGISEIMRFGWRRRYPWDCVEQVESRDDGARIHTTRGTIEVGPGVQGGRLLLDRVIAELDQRREQSTSPTVSPQQIAAWLGIGPEETLVVESQASPKQRRQGILIGGGCLGALVGVPLVILGFAQGGGALWWPIGSVWLVSVGLTMAKLSGLEVLRIEASAEGLYVVRRRGMARLAWSAIQTISRFGEARQAPVWRLVAGKVTVLLSENDPCAARLIHAIQQALDARRGGAALPRMSGASDAAISPVSASVSAERGVSRAEGDPEP